MDKYEPDKIERKWQEVWEAERAFYAPNPEPGAEPERKFYMLEMLPYPSGTLHMGHVLNYTLGDVITHLPAAHRLARDAPDGLRLVRPTGGERGHPRGRSSPRDRRAEHRAHPDRDEAPGLGHRLGPRDLRARGRVLPLDPVAVPEVLRGGPGLPESRTCPVVPERPDRRRERVRDRRQVRALRHPGRREEHGAVVLQDHGLRRSAAGGPEADRLARADEDDPDELDRPLGGRRGHLPRRGARPGHSRLHDPAGHAVRRDVLRPGAGAPDRREAGKRRGGRLRGEGRGEARRGAPDEGEGRPLHRPLRRQPGQRRADPGLGRRLRADGLRDGRDHGRPGARRA